MNGPGLVAQPKDAPIGFGHMKRKGIKHMDIPCFPARVWAAMNGNAQPPQ